jgi:protein-S-isoprenylcysteine O-methyltransferase Ste14
MDLNPKKVKQMTLIKNGTARSIIGSGLVVAGLTLMFAAQKSAHADLMTTAVQWFYTNFAVGLVGAAVLIAGALCLAGRMGLLMGAGIICGALIIGNYQTIVAAIMAGSGG